MHPYWGVWYIMSLYGGISQGLLESLYLKRFIIYSSYSFNSQSSCNHGIGRGLPCPHLWYFMYLSLTHLLISLNVSTSDLTSKFNWLLVIGTVCNLFLYTTWYFGDIHWVRICLINPNFNGYSFESPSNCHWFDMYFDVIILCKPSKPRFYGESFANA